MLLVGGAVLTARLLARTLDLTNPCQLHSQHVRLATGNPLPHTFRRLQLTHAFETLGPRRAVVRRGDVISVDSLTSGRELMVLVVDVLFVRCLSTRERRSRVGAEERIRSVWSVPPASTREQCDSQKA